MRIPWLSGLFLFLLAGCAANARLDISCPPFDGFRRDVPFTDLERQIRGLPVNAAPGDRVLRNRIDRMLRDDPAAPRDARPAVLMLSGGGQWGAFGVGFLDELRERGALPEARLISGISTGALQSLFVAIGTPEAFAELRAAYAPASEKEIVDRGGILRIFSSGSLARLGPLKARLERALCPDEAIDDPARSCALDALKAMITPEGQKKYVLIGMVEAASGRFEYVDAVELAQLPRREARNCITGAALASAAMPVSFEQVRINGRAYYDGGTRASIFEANVAATAEEAMGGSARLPIYIVRNGPTTVVRDEKVDGDAGALTAAQRSVAILINQIEVGSIAAVRIAHPRGRVALVTADGHEAASCVKPEDGTMFAPAFMRCLTEFGRAKARSDQPWILLSELAGPPRR